MIQVIDYSNMWIIYCLFSDFDFCLQTIRYRSGWRDNNPLRTILGHGVQSKSINHAPGMLPQVFSSGCCGDTLFKAYRHIEVPNKDKNYSASTCEKSIRISKINIYLYICNFVVQTKFDQITEHFIWRLIFIEIYVHVCWNAL